LENWLYWTIGDLVAVVYNHLIGYDGYALLNAVYIALAVVGFVRWRQQWRRQQGTVLA
jgi:nicotinamide mononucleotide transporter